MKIYISGKITSSNNWKEDYSKTVEQFEHLKKQFIELGYDDVIIPTELCTPDMDWEQCMIVCLKAMLDCDAVYFFNDWVNSKGAVIEFNLAKSLGMPIYNMG